MVATKKSKEEVLHSITARGQREKSIAALEAEKAKPVTIPKKFVSSKKLFPDRPELHIEVPKSATKKEVDAIITKRMTKVTENPFIRYNKPKNPNIKWKK